MKKAFALSLLCIVLLFAALPMAAHADTGPKPSVTVSIKGLGGARLLIAAYRTAYAVFYNGFIRGHITLIRCPELEGADYSGKPAGIIKNGDIKASPSRACSALTFNLTAA